MGEDDFRARWFDLSEKEVVSEGSTILISLEEPHFIDQMPNRFEIGALRGAFHNTILSTFVT